ncbi:MAG: alpha/beta hydrolase [Myxococcota bacterium]
MGRATPLFLLLVIACADGTNDQPARQLEASGTFESDGLTIHYESYGEGDPIILVHGWGTDIQFNWVVPGWVEALRNERQVIAIDVRGHGESDKPLQQELYSYQLMANDVLNLMNTFGIERADYLGYSMGSFMGAFLLGHHADRFNAMILGGIGDETEESVATASPIADALRTEDPSTITDPDAIAYRQLVDLDPRNDAEAREALALAALQMWPEGFPVMLGGDGLRNAAVRVLIVNGQDDIPYAQTVSPFVNAVPDAELLEIPGADHFGAVFSPVFQEAAVAFLRGESSPTRP